MKQAVALQVRRRRRQAARHRRRLARRRRREVVHHLPRRQVRRHRLAARRLAARRLAAKAARPNRLQVIRLIRHRQVLRVLRRVAATVLRQSHRTQVPIRLVARRLQILNRALRVHQVRRRQVARPIHHRPVRQIHRPRSHRRKIQRRIQATSRCLPAITIRATTGRRAWPRGTG